MSRSVNAVLAAVLCAAASFAFAQAPYPSKAVRFVVPYAPGGATDIITRVVAEQYQRAFSQPFTVENRPSAGGIIGAADVAKSAPDGYTILMSSVGPQAVNQYLYSKMPYNTQKDFAPVILVAHIPNVLVVPASLGVKTIQELIERARAKPGSLNYASGGSGSSGHLSVELFRARTNSALLHIPYKGTGQALQDLVSGQVQLMIDNLTPLLPFIKAGKLLALGVTTSKRVSSLPDVPTIGSVVPGYEVSAWVAIMAPAGTPAPIIARLNAEGNAMLQKPEVRQRLESLSAQPAGGTAEELGKFLVNEWAKWKPVVELSGAKAD